MPIGTFNTNGNDGQANKSNTTYSTARSNPADNAGTVTSAVIAQDEFTTPNYNVGRGFFPFNTSSIGVGATVNSGSIGLWCISVNNGQTGTIMAVQSTIAGGGTPTVNSFTNFGTVQWGSATLTTANATAGQYNYIPLNATGLGSINTTGTTSIAIISENDRLGGASTPTLRSFYNTYFSQQGGGSVPILILNYSTPGGGLLMSDI